MRRVNATQMTRERSRGGGGGVVGGGFFFSSRRRHTRWACDWSSDVCSSDLSAGHHVPHQALQRDAKIHFRPLWRLQFGPFLGVDPNMDIDDVVQAEERLRLAGRLRPLAKRQRQGKNSDCGKTTHQRMNGCNIYFRFVSVLAFLDRKSTRLNSSHKPISYAVFCLKKKTHNPPPPPPIV